MPSWLCRLGLHIWRNYGESVLTVWKEPGLLPGTKAEKRKHVYSERECLRCGLRMKRKLSENLDGTQATIGWEITEESHK